MDLSCVCRSGFVVFCFFCDLHVGTGSLLFICPRSAAMPRPSSATEGIQEAITGDPISLAAGAHRIETRDFPKVRPARISPQPAQISALFSRKSPSPKCQKNFLEILVRGNSWGHFPERTETRESSCRRTMYSITLAMRGHAPYGRTNHMDMERWMGGLE